MEKGFELKKDKYLSKIINFYIFFIPIYYILNILIGEKSHYIFAIIINLWIIAGVKYFNKFKKKAVIALFSFFILSSFYSFLGYSGHIYNWIGLIFMLFCCSFPFFIIGLYVDDFDVILQGLKKCIIFAYLSNILLIIFCYKTGRSMSGNMEISYSFLPLAIISLYFALKQKNIIHLISFIVALAVIIAVGSRGPLLCILTFLLLFLMSDWKKNKLFIILIVLFSIVLFNNYTDILNTMIDICNQYDINSRTLYKIRNGTISDDTGRGNIQENALKQLNENPILGTGIGVERIKINNEIMHKDMGSAYPHNLIIEILVQYGYILGPILILYLLYIFIKSITKASHQERDLLIIMFSTEIVRLMISSSYLRSSLFFLWLGLTINVVYKKKGMKSIEKININSTNSIINSSSKGWSC